jgi:2-iminoacetate synthase
LPNALITLKEYTNDYASPEVKEKAKAMIQRLLQTVPNEKARATAAKYLDAIDHGERDFRF